jgi:hypothetical protein
VESPNLGCEAVPIRAIARSAAALRRASHWRRGESPARRRADERSAMRSSENSQVMGVITPNQPNLVAGVGWHQQQPLISAHRLPHRGSGIQFPDNLPWMRSSRSRSAEARDGRPVRAPASSGSPLLLAADGEASTGLIRAELTLPFGTRVELSSERRSTRCDVPASVPMRKSRWRGIARS